VRKSIFLFLFLSIFVFIQNSIILAVNQDEIDTLAIQWESKTTYPFFNKWGAYGVGARALGMGEAFAAIADDASAVYYNPAGLAQMDHNELSWTGGSLYNGVPYTDFATFDMALGGQYFALSYEKLYHPTGAYPNNIQIPNVNGTGNGIGPGGLFAGDAPTSMNPGTYARWYGDIVPSMQQFLGQMYRTYVNPPFQEDQVVLTYSTPLTADKSFDFGVNVKYEFSDAGMMNTVGNNYDAWAWALDLGFLYKLRIIEFLKDLNVGIMLRDISGRFQYYSSGVAMPLYFTSDVALSMRTTELIEKEITSFSIDWDAVNDPGVFQDEQNRIKFGFEQWFIDGHFALRGGLIWPMNQQPWRMSLGVSAKYIIGIDYAYLRGLPFDQEAENEGDSHWISLTWAWGKVARKLPTPDVFAAVEPLSFAPKNGETAIFKLNATSKAGIDRWALNILDSKNNLVKSYVDIGVPPSQIVWNGSDNKYQVLPDGEYSFIFEATDKLGSTSSTPVQSVKIYTPVIEGVNPKVLDDLRKLLNNLKAKDEGNEAALASSMKRDLDALKKAKTKPTPVPPPGPAPEYFVTPTTATAAPQGVSTAAGPVTILGYPNIDASAVKSAAIATSPDGTKNFNMEYYTENTQPKYVMKEMGLIIRSIAESLGYSIDRIGVNALYGNNNNLSLTVPIAQAENYARGQITVEQMLRGANMSINGSGAMTIDQVMGANVNLNGQAIYPNF
jgi:hypothetical protein